MQNFFWRSPWRFQFQTWHLNSLLLKSVAENCVSHVVFIEEEKTTCWAGRSSHSWRQYDACFPLFGKHGPDLLQIWFATSQWQSCQVWGVVHSGVRHALWPWMTSNDAASTERRSVHRVAQWRSLWRAQCDAALDAKARPRHVLFFFAARQTGRCGGHCWGLLIDSSTKETLHFRASRLSQGARAAVQSSHGRLEGEFEPWVKPWDRGVRAAE